MRSGSLCSSRIRNDSALRNGEVPATSSAAASVAPMSKIRRFRCTSTGSLSRESYTRARTSRSLMLPTPVQWSAQRVRPPLRHRREHRLRLGQRGSTRHEGLDRHHAGLRSVRVRLRARVATPMGSAGRYYAVQPAAHAHLASRASRASGGRHVRALAVRDQQQLLRIRLVRRSDPPIVQVRHVSRCDQAADQTIYVRNAGAQSKSRCTAPHALIRIHTDMDWRQ